jgi:hypothetical protein
MKFLDSYYNWKDQHSYIKNLIEEKHLSHYLVVLMLTLNLDQFTIYHKNL